MTEAEAKQRWCPFARAPFPGGMGASVNRADTGEIISGTRCIASACMAWRVSDRQLYRHEELVQHQQPVGDGWYSMNPRPAGGAPITWLRDVPLGGSGGFCGLSGAPS